MSRMEDDFPIRGDLGTAWGKLISDSFHIYRGYVAEMVPNGVRFENRFYRVNEFEVHIDAHIKGGIESIQNSINRIK